MKIFTPLFLALRILVGISWYSCSSQLDNSNGENTGNFNPVEPIYLENRVISNKKALMSLSRVAERISLINTTTEKEEWGKQIGKYKFAVALPNLEGIVLVGDDSISIHTSDSEQEFEIGGNWHHFSYSKTHPAYSFTREDGNQFEILRFLGNNQWQTEQFDLPWNPLFDPVILPKPGNLLFLLSAWDASGTRLIAFSPINGNYALFVSNPATGRLETTQVNCPGDSISDVANGLFHSYAWDDDSNTLFAGTSSGKIIAFSILESCLPIANRPALELSESFAITHLTYYGDETLGYSQDNNYYTVKFDGINFSNNTLIYSDVCTNPITSTPLNSDYILVVCNPGDMQFKSQLMTRITAIEQYQYITIDVKSNKIIPLEPISVNRTAGYAIDAEQTLLYRMLNDTLGTLEITHLLNGQKRKRTGIFLDNILD